MNKVFLILLGTGILFSSCTYDKSEALNPGGNPCSGLNISYASDIKPIIQSSCALAGCHNNTSTNAGGPFTNYTQVKDHAVSIKTQVVSRIMPRGSSLSAAQIQMISCWVDSGAPNN